VTTQIDVWKDVHAERKALLELLQNLSASQWDTPSLCSEWRVRDVVDTWSAKPNDDTKVLVTIASGFRINRFMPLTHAVARRCLPSLLDDFRTAQDEHAPPWTSSLSMLDDVIIHSLDIRRPLNEKRNVPESRYVLVANDLWSSRFFPGQKLFNGLRVEATDAYWSAGDGPTVAGPLEDLILAMSADLEVSNRLGAREGLKYSREHSTDSEIVVSQREQSIRWKVLMPIERPKRKLRRQELLEPAVDQYFHKSPYANLSTLSRWRHGFESRWGAL